jgi:AcrR family transcriptional regulator
MRTRLLDATIDCLIEYGCGGTTTPRVAEKAGVTRGAQVHHFGSKADLVVAAVQHLAGKRVEEVLQRIDAMSEYESDPVGMTLDFLWEIHRGPVHAASIELWTAGRTDRALAAEIAKFEESVTKTIIAAVSQRIPEHADRKTARDFVFTAMDTMRGISVAGFVDDDPDRLERKWRRARKFLYDAGVHALEGRLQAGASG